MQVDHNISPGTRCAEGFFNGLKLSICHALTYGIYFSKEESLKNQTSFLREYLKHVPKSSAFYCVLISATYGMRQLVFQNKDVIMARMHPSLRRQRTAAEILMYFGVYLPMGTAINYLQSGRIVRGTFSITLLIALVMRTIEKASN